MPSHCKLTVLGLAALDVVSLSFLPDPRLWSKPTWERTEAQRGKGLAQGHIAGCPGSQEE